MLDYIFFVFKKTTLKQFLQTKFFAMVKTMLCRHQVVAS